MIRTPCSHFRGPDSIPGQNIYIYIFLFTLITSLKALTPNTVTLKVSTSSYEFEEDTIQSITRELEDYFYNVLGRGWDDLGEWEF